MTAPRTATAAAAAAAAGVLAQICYPLLHGGVRAADTVLTVLALAAAAVLAAAGRGAAVGLAVGALTAGAGLAAELVGVHTGLPFGHYRYTARLGPQLAGVPLVVPLAWTMIAWPAAVLARRAVPTGRWPLRALVGGVAMVAWDLVLDPQMVAAHNWVWRYPHPGYAGVPLTNVAGWTLVATTLSAALLPLAATRPAGARQRPHGTTLPTPTATGTAAGTPAGTVAGTAPGTAPGDGVCVAVYSWTWIGSAVANVAFFHRPAVGLLGLVALGAVLGLAVRGRRPHAPTGGWRPGRTPVPAP